jgi:hypothetical protein
MEFSMKLKTIATAAVLALPLLGGVAVASPALADCPANTFCLYPNSGYGGTEYRFAPGDSCTGFVSGIANNANAMRNYRNNYVRMWDFPGCVGQLTYTANPLSYDSDFGNNNFTDKASSLKRI